MSDHLIFLGLLHVTKSFVTSEWLNPYHNLLQGEQEVLCAGQNILSAFAGSCVSWS